MDVDVFRPPAGPGELDFVAWLEEIGSGGGRRVWLLRRDVPRVNVRHIAGENSYEAAGATGTRAVGVSVPQIRPPVDAPPEPPPGYDDRLSTLAAWATDLHALQSSAAADLAAREPELAEALARLQDGDYEPRLLTAGRQRLHDAGAWPWAVVDGGWLGFDWWARAEFATALAKWAEPPD